MKRSYLIILLLLLVATIVVVVLNRERLISYLTKSTPDNRPTPQVTPPNEIKYTETSVTFLAVGDIMLSRGVNSAIARTNNPLQPFSSLTKLLESTDFNFGNLECPISGSDKPGPPHSLTFNAPVRNVQGLKKYNFQVLNLANNHALDQRAAGLHNTRKVLTENDITYLGVGENLTEAWKPKVILVNGLRIGFLGVSYASVNDGGVTRNELVARLEDTEKLKEALAKLRPMADFIVVTMHAGIEYTLHPIAAQVDFAHQAIDSGADIVIGAHPHWIQSIERYQNKYVFYSLGNFIFDQTWSEKTKQGLVLQIQLKGYKPLVNQIANIKTKPPATELVEIELLPVIIERASTPRLANEQEKAKILAAIGLTEAKLTSNSNLPTLVVAQ